MRRYFTVKCHVRNNQLLENLGLNTSELKLCFVSAIIRALSMTRSYLGEPSDVDVPERSFIW